MNVWNGIALRWPWANSGYVCVRVRLNLKVLLVIDAVWVRNLTLTLIMFIQPYTMATALRWSSVVEYMERVPCWPWTNRTYVCVCLNLNVLFVFNAVWGRNLTPMRYFVVQIYTTMAMTTLHWSSLVGYMERVPCWTNSPYVCIAACAWTWMCYYWRLIQYAISPSCVVQIHYITMTITALRWFSFVECMAWCRVVPGQTARTFALLCVCLNLKLLLVFDAVWGCNASHLCAVQTHHDGDGGSVSSPFSVSTAATDNTYVCSYFLNWAALLIGVWCSMRS